MALQPNKDRIFALDAVRGVAVLGVLLAAITYFAYPWGPGSVLPSFKGVPGSQPWIEGVMTAFVNGTFRGLLELLFGIGLYFQFLKRKEMFVTPPPSLTVYPRGVSTHNTEWPRAYRRRMWILACFGLASFALAWMMGLLAVFAVAALVTTWFVNLDESRLKLWILNLFAFCFLLTAVLSWASWAMFQEVSLPAESVILGMTESQVFQQGTFLQQVVFRLEHLPMLAITLWMLLPFYVMGLLIGVLLAKSGFVANPESRPDVFRYSMIVCFGFGLPFKLLCGYAAYAGWFHDIPVIVGALPAVFLSLGMLVLALRYGKGPWCKVFTPFAKLGRVALSAYVLQALICSVLFYSWGFGWYGVMSVSQLLTVVVGVWLSLIAFAHLWLWRFDIGPMEWLWRSWAERRRLPWRTRNEPTAAI